MNLSHVIKLVLKTYIPLKWVSQGVWLISVAKTVYQKSETRSTRGDDRPLCSTSTQSVICIHSPVRQPVMVMSNDCLP